MGGIKLLIIIGIILFNNLHCGSAKRNKPSAKIVAQRTGAFKFEEYSDDENASHESKLKKRFSHDPDIDTSFVNDPEIYQGVLGRPGVDFPVMPRIPRTNFDCRNFGNGYFADLETNCQVFHICDEGRKISFLCPNGTIFRQIDLICDWWFKVDCNAAPEHYAESSEQLQRAQKLRQQSQKLRHVVHSELGFGTSGEVSFRNDARPAESIQKPTVRLPQGRAFRAPQNAKINKRMDVISAAGRKQEVDASEILYNRRNVRQKERKPVEQEIQETAETASFVDNRNSQNGYSYPAPEQKGYQYLPPRESYPYPETRGSFQANNEAEKSSFLQKPQPFNTRPTEGPSEMYVSTIASMELTTSRRGNKLGSNSPVTEKPQSNSTSRGSTTYASSLKASTEKNGIVGNGGQTTSENIKTTTPYETEKVNKYTTARKPAGRTKETPFYTPTVPTTTPKVLIQSTTLPPATVTESTSSVIKHAIELMDTLKELNMGEVLTSETEKYMGQRMGIEVPPSTGPNTLASLALYFANGDTNNTKRMTNSISSVFLSNKTVSKYETLFPNEKNTSDISTTKQPLLDETTYSYAQQDAENDLETQYSKHPLLSAAGTPQLREIAQVFTHALSAYLQDPEQFRKILSEIRPTEPPNVALNEIPGDSEFVRQETGINVARQTQKSEDLEIFDYSDVTVASKLEDTTSVDNEQITTTEGNSITTSYYPQVTEALPQPTSKLADKTPASRFVTDNLEKNASKFNERSGKNLESENSSLSADEINNNLATSKYKDSNFNDDFATNYFPEDRSNKSKLAPYGFGVKPENSTPINDPFPTSLSDTQAIPLQWGDELTTIEPFTDETPTVYSELLPPFDINGREVYSMPSNGLQLPNEENDEHLQPAQSQSFVSSRNNIYSEMKKSKTYNDYLNYNEEFLLGTTNFGERIVTTTTEMPQTTSSIRGHFVTKAVPSTSTEAASTETTTLDYTTLIPETTKSSSYSDTGIINSGDSKTTLSYSVFLDPLTINDGLMEGDEDKTPVPKNDFSSTEQVRRGKSSFATTPLTIRFNEDRDESNTIEPMQKRANEMFGQLNETQVSHLMNVMKKADENRNVRRLILLLIQTCDGDDHNKTLEASRTALLNALIGMDTNDASDRSEIKIYNTRREKSVRTPATTTTLPSVPITTYKSPNHEKYASSENLSKELESTALPLEQTTYYTSQSTTNEREESTQNFIYSTTEAEYSTTPATTEVPATTTNIPAIVERNSEKLTNSKPRFRLKSNGASLRTGHESARYQKSLGLNDEYQSEPTNTIEHKKADARALELLRSLYSLASRWGRK